MIRRIATLGGFLGRKCDGEPGVKTLWLGFARLGDCVWRIEFIQSTHPKCVAYKGVNRGFSSRNEKFSPAEYFNF